jgi:hypothetical protein
MAAIKGGRYVRPAAELWTGLQKKETRTKNRFLICGIILVACGIVFRQAG